MTPNLLQYVRLLSERDRKTLSQKVLKLGEEFGELAKVALPFENAYATTHRFTERESILEESVDSILCALSVAYDLKFTDDEVEEMMLRKAEKWAQLQNKETDITYPIPYEIHVTVHYEPYGAVTEEDFTDGFKNVCKHLGVKPIVLDLQARDGKVAMVDVMTSSKHFGTNASAYAEATRISRGLRDADYTVVRIKIETVPWHPAAPVEDEPMPPNCYFESHIPVHVPGFMLLKKLRDDITNYNNPYLHLSRNAFKTNPDGSSVLMVTMRVNFGNYAGFKSHLDAFVEHLSERWSVGKVISEFSIYDTKVSHDATWIKG